MKEVPYASATSGESAREEIRKILQHFGCSQVGFMDDFEQRSLILQFKWKSRTVQLTASAEGWAAHYLQQHPWHSRCRHTPESWKERALRQGHIAINSVLRDLVKGQMTAIESGLLRFDHVYLPFMLTRAGETIAEAYADKLPLLIEGGADA